MKYLILMAGAALLIFLFLFSFKGSDKGGRCFVETKEVIRSIYGSGYVRSEKQVFVRAGVSGYVKKIYVKEGDRVKKGNLIALVDSAGLENKIRSLEQRIELLKSRLQPNSEFMKALKYEVDIKRENLEKARKRYLRRRELFRKGVIPRESLEEAERLFRVTYESYRITQSNLKDKIEELKTELRSLEEEKKALEKEFEKYKIRSPISGIVLKKYAEEGDYINHISRENVIVSVGSSERKVVLNVDEEVFPLIRKGQKVYITMDAQPGKVFEGEVVGYDLESEPARRVVEVYVKVDLPSGIPINSVVEGNIIIDRLKTTVIPIEAVKDGSAVLLVNGEKKRIKVNRIFENYAEVLGYSPGTPCLIKK